MWSIIDKLLKVSEWTNLRIKKKKKKKTPEEPGHRWNPTIFWDLPPGAWSGATVNRGKSLCASSIERRKLMILSISLKHSVLLNKILTRN